MLIFLCMFAECCPLGTFFHWAHSYGFIIHYGAHRIDNICEHSSQGWNIFLVNYIVHPWYDLIA